MAFETTTVPCKSLPAAAAGTNISLSATPWANGAYAQVTASLAAAIQLGSAMITTFGGTASGDEIEIDIAKGGAGSEVVVTTIRYVKNTSGQYAPNFRFRPIVDNIPTTTRIAVRGRHRSAETGTIAIGFNYYEKPTGIAQVSAQPHKWWPSAANGVDIAGSGAINSEGLSIGAWSQLVASAAADSVLCAFYAQVTINAQAVPHWIEFGVGSAGNEVVVATFRIRVQTNAGSALPYVLPAPLDLFPLGSRVSIRMKTRSTGTTSLRCAAQYMEKPL